MLARLGVYAAMAAWVSTAAACASEPEMPPPPPPTRLAIEAVSATSGDLIPNARVLVGASGWQAAGDDGVVVQDVAAGEVSLRIQAPGYFPIPRPLRSAVSVTAAANETTEVTVELQPSNLGTAVISGRVVDDAGAPVAGALVVAASTLDFAGHSDGDGRFVIAGVAPNVYTLSALSAGYTSSSEAGVSVAEGDVRDDLTITLTAGADGAVSGMVDGEAGTVGVLLVHPETGYAVPGLEARTTSSRRYSIEGVAPGRYALRAALDLDGLVLDPQAIRSSGPPIAHVEAATTTEVDLVLAPSIRGIRPTGTSTTSAVPAFEWPEVPGADFYVIEVRDASDQVLWGGFDAFGSARFRILPPDTSIMYGGPRALTPGATYTWRVFAAEQDPLIPSNFTLVAASEVLAGEFRVAR